MSIYGYLSILVSYPSSEVDCSISTQSRSVILLKGLCAPPLSMESLAKHSTQTNEHLCNSSGLSRHYLSEPILFTLYYGVNPVELNNQLA